MRVLCTLILLLLFSSLLTDACLAIQEGNIIWTCVLGSDSNENGNCGLLTADGNYLIGGYTRMYGGGASFITLLSPDGDSLDGVVMGHTAMGVGGCVSMVRLADGYVYSANNMTGTYLKYEVAKIDLNLDSIWCYRYGGPSGDVARGITSAHAVPESSFTGGFVLTGYSKSFGAGTPSKSNIWMLFVDENGDSAWSKIYGNTGTEINEITYPIIQDTGTNRYVTVYGTQETSNFQARCVFTTAAGDSVDGLDFGTLAASKHEQFYSVIQTADGGFAMAGWCSASGQPAGDNIYFGRMSSGGDSIITRFYGGAGNERAFGLVETANGNFVLTGQTSSFGSGDNDFFLLKVNSDGDSIWMKTFGGDDKDDAHAIFLTPEGDYVIVGDTESYGPGIGSATELNIWVLKISGHTESKSQIISIR